MQGRVTIPLFGTATFEEHMTESYEILVAALHLIRSEMPSSYFFKYNASLFPPRWSRKQIVSAATIRECG